ncbi:MAG: MFS transporter [Coriobacteriia bacterium]|nr:MFS transporter [Coriobacteriia bacterium]
MGRPVRAVHAYDGAMKNRHLLIIFVVVLVNMLAFGIVIPLLPYLADKTGASEFQIGLLVASYPLAQLVGAPLLGRLSDRYGRKPILLLSILGTAIGFVVLALANSLPLLFLSRVIDGLTGGNINVAQAYIADVTDHKERGKAMGLIGAAFGLGFVVGPVTGGLLSDISYSAPAWAGAAISVVNLAAVTLFLPESLSSEARARLVALKRKVFDLAGLRHAIKHRRVGPILTIRAVTGVSFALFETMFSLWALAALGFKASQTGIFLGYIGVLSVIVQAGLIGRLTKRFSDDALLLGGVGLSGVSLLAWAFVPNVLLLVLVVVPLSLGLAVSSTVMTSALSKAVGADEVGGVLGAQTSIMSLTRVVAPIIGGFLLQHATVWSPGLLAGLLTLAMAPYAWRTLCLAPGRSSCEESFDEA